MSASTLNNNPRRTGSRPAAQGSAELLPREDPPPTSRLTRGGRPYLASRTAYHAGVMLKRSTTQKVLDQLAERHLVNVSCYTDAGHHAHPTLALERELLLQSVTKMFARCYEGELVHDVYGNDAALTRLGIEHHSTMPSRHQSDLTRRLVANAATSCEHEPWECDCKEFGIALSVQSLQYLPIEKVVEVIYATRTKTMYAVMHRYDGIAGNFYKTEMEYYRSDPDNVVCKMDGGNTIWSHSALDWVGRLPTCAKYPGVCVSASFVETVGVTHLVRLTLAPHDGTVPRSLPFDWNQSLTGDAEVIYNLSKGEDLKKVHQAFSLMGADLRFSRLRVYSGLVVLEGERCRRVVLSSAILANLRGMVATKSVTPELYGSLMRQAMADYGRVPNLPGELVPDAAFASVLLALSLTPQMTVGTMTQFLYNNGAIIRKHNQLIRLEEPVSVSTTTVAACVVSTAVSASVSYVAPTTVHWAAPTTTALVLGHASTHVMLQATVGPVVVVVPPLAAAWAVVSAASTAYWLYKTWGGKQHEDSSVVAWGETQPGESTFLTRPVVLIDYTPKFGALYRFKEPGPQREGTNVRETLDVVPKVERKRLQHLGIAISGYIPTYYPQTPEAALNAIKARITVERPKPIPGVWVGIEAQYKSTAFFQAYRKTAVVELNVQLVEAVLRQQYTSKLAGEYLKEYVELELRGFTLTAKEKRFGMMIKEEKQMAVVFENQEPARLHALKNPRPICTMHPRVIGASVALNQELMTRWKEAYSHLAERGVPGFGPRWVSVETFGVWYLDATVVLSDYYVISVDAERFDGHVYDGPERFATNINVNSLRFASNAQKQMFQPQKVVIKSKLGVEVDGLGEGRATGQWQTDMNNSKITEGMILHILENGPVSTHLGVDYFAAACGDDSLVLIRKEYAHRILRVGNEDVTIASMTEVWTQRGLGMGFRLTPIFFSNGPEFCSKWFYPTGGLLLMGGKIGRVLTRAAWFFENDTSPIKSSARSQLRDNYHVPFLRQYFEKVVELTDGMVEPPLTKERRHYWHTEKPHEYDDSTWEFVTAKYGLTRQDLGEFVALLAEVTSLPVVVDWPKIHHLVQIDNA